jgi:hypothetical protein
VAGGVAAISAQHVAEERLRGIFGVKPVGGVASSLVDFPINLARRRDLLTGDIYYDLDALNTCVIICLKNLRQALAGYGHIVAVVRRYDRGDSNRYCA